jgi:hypothetical protein
MSHVRIEWKSFFRKNEYDISLVMTRHTCCASDRKKERARRGFRVDELVEKQETEERTSACAPSNRSGWSGASFAN